MNETTQITYEGGAITIAVSTESASEVAAPDIRFANYEEIAKSCFTEDELEIIASGKAADVKFKFIMKDEPTNKTELAQFEEAIEVSQSENGPLTKGVFFETQAYKSVAGDKQEALDNFYEPVNLQFGVPMYLNSNDRFYYIMVNDMGVCQLMPDEDKDEDDVAITTNKIGTYLMLYQRNIDRPVDSSGNFGAYLKSHALIFVLLAILIIAWLAVEKIKRNR